MKLVLANNQSEKFIRFHRDIQKAQKLYDYADYKSLLFYFEKGVTSITNVQSNVSIDSYDGVYLNGYLDTPEIAYATATVLDFLNVPYVNKELHGAPSQTKLTAYAKLAVNDIDVPKTYAGTAWALRQALTSGTLDRFPLPVVIKRADADRGIDNFVFDSYAEVKTVLDRADDLTIWLIQEFIPNDGFYLLSFMNHELSYGVFRSLEKRTDNRKELAHMFKPHGGRNATFLEPNDTPQAIVDVSRRATIAMNRQIASVDSIYNAETGRVSILEVNYNPQLVTVSTFSTQKKIAFLKSIKSIE